MAKYIGKVLSGTVLALCTVLFMTGQTWGDEFGGGPIKQTISGSIGMPGVTMQGLPPGTQTDQNGVYSAQVSYGFTGTVTPVKEGYTFEPSKMEYKNLRENRTNDNYRATPKTYTISGSVGLAGVKMTGLPGDPNTDQAGRYSATVFHNWNGVVTPEKSGYQFEPSSKAYDQVTVNQTQDFKAIEITYTISGTISGLVGGDANGVTLQGLPNDPRTSPSGVYRVKVPFGWHGKVTPMKEGYTFTPPNMEYASMTDDRSGQDYAAKAFEYTITGTTNMAGVTLKGLPGDPVSDVDGFYRATVPYGWTGKVQAIYKGYTFEPPSYNYPKITANRERQDFKPSPVRLTISGTVAGSTGAAVSGVKMTGLPDNPVTDAKGFYSVKVEFDFNGTVTPTKEGWSFAEASKTYSALETEQTNQNYKAVPITYIISGNVGGQPNVVLTLEGLPKTVTSGVDGSYSAEVPYKWTGTVTPKKPGVAFDPPSVKYEPMISSKIQDYVAKPIQFTISGKVIGQEAGAGPISDASITTEPGGIMATTDAKGEYRIQVDYGWKGTIQVVKGGVVFAQDKRIIVDPVMRDMLDQGFSGKVRMLTITSIVIMGGQPIEGVAITAMPGNYKAVTDSKGKYTISVPHGWSGELKAEKEGWEFQNTIKYENVTENIDKTSPAKPPVTTPPVNPVTQPPVNPVTQPSVNPVTQPSVNPVTQPPVNPVTTSQAEKDRERVIEELRKLGIDVSKLIDSNSGRTTTTLGPAPAGNLIDILAMISQKTGAKIAVDATVKPVPVTTTASVLTGMPASMALKEVLSSISGTPYRFKQPEKDTYLVYKSITTNFAGDDLTLALQSLAAMADVPIMIDENVVGKVTAQLTDMTLEQALEMVLAGTSFVYKRMPNNYVVASGLPKHSAFGMVSVTQQVSLNYIMPTRAAELLSGAWTDYVKASQDPNSHLITVTAPQQLADRIVADIKRLDRCPRQVLLTARVVSIERGNMLNLGMEWGMPKIRAGAFSDSYVRGVVTGDHPAGTTPWGVQIGYSPDKTFTDSLLLSLNLLQENGQADIVANPQVMAMDGKPSQIKNIVEEWFMMSAPTNGNLFYTQSQLEKIESGTILTITPLIGDNNDIRLEMAVEVSDSIPSGVGSNLPVITRRQAKNYVTIPDGGTAAVSGLTENRSRVKDSRVPGLSSLPLIGNLFKNSNSDKSTREVAVFVTANIASENTQLAYPTMNNSSLDQASATPAAVGGSFQDELKQGVASQSR